MDLKESVKQILVVLAVAIVLGVCYAFPNKTTSVGMFIIFFAIILGVNILSKKYVAYLFEADLKPKIWSVYSYHFKQAAHFKTPIYMLWFPVFLSLVSRGYLFWMQILEFDIKPRVERVARRHEGMYRFTELTEFNVALIVMWGIISNLALAIVGYILGGYIPGGELFSKLNIYYALWSLVPISSLDGTKVFFGSRALWFSLVVIVLVFFFFSFMIFI